MTAKRTLIPAFVLAAGLACTASAQAQPYGNAWGYSRVDARVAFDNGYRSGFDRGRDDARHQRYDYGRHDEYRSANWATSATTAIAINIVTRSVAASCRATTTATTAGTRATAPTATTVTATTTVIARCPRPHPSTAAPIRAHPSTAALRRKLRVQPGYDRGYREGLDKGRNDGKHHDWYDPRRQKWYRDGDRGYKDKYGSRRTYENSYRDGFLRGYDQGYRERSRY